MAARYCCKEDCWQIGPCCAHGVDELATSVYCAMQNCWQINPCFAHADELVEDDAHVNKVLFGNHAQDPVPRVHPLTVSVLKTKEMLFCGRDIQGY